MKKQTMRKRHILFILCAVVCILGGAAGLGAVLAMGGSGADARQSDGAATRPESGVSPGTAARGAALPPGSMPWSRMQGSMSGQMSGQPTGQPAQDTPAQDAPAVTYGTNSRMESNPYGGYPGFAGTWRDPESGDVITSIIAPRQPQQPAWNQPIIVSPEIYPGWNQTRPQPPRPHPGPWPGPQPGPHPGPWPGPHPGPHPGPWPGPQPGPHPGPWPGPQPGPMPGPPPRPYPGSLPGWQGGNRPGAMIPGQSMPGRPHAPGVRPGAGRPDGMSHGMPRGMVPARPGGGR